jgi:zinc/manganese transport system permease protein
MNTDALEPSILLPAFAAGVLVLATHVPLGMQVLKRGIVFIDLAVAQVAGLGVIAADRLGWEPQGWAVQAAALGAALAGALLLTWTERRWPAVQEALIGSLFVLAATGATILLADNPHGGEHLKDLLVGQILWVSNGQLLGMAVVSAVVLAAWLASGRSFGRVAFYLAFAVSVTASVQLVGVYLVFASLIIPALAVRRHARRGLAYGYILGLLGYGAGLLVSALFDLPTGPVVVWALAACALLLAPVLNSERPLRISKLWKRAPEGNPINRKVKFQAEYFWRNEDERLAFNTAGLLGDPLVGSYDSHQSGWYAQAVYQFMPRWRVGGRYDEINSGSPCIRLVENGAVSTANFPPPRDEQPVGGNRDDRLVAQRAQSATARVRGRQLVLKCQGPPAPSVVRHEPRRPRHPHLAGTAMYPQTPLHIAILALSALLPAGCATPAGPCSPIKVKRGHASDPVRGVAPPDEVVCYTPYSTVAVQNHM